MESDETRISFFLVEPEDNISRWRSAGPTPDGSPLDLHEHAFPDLEPNSVFHGVEASRMHSEVPHSNGFTAALNQQLGSIDLTSHGKSVVPHMMAFSPFSHDEVRAMSFGVERPAEWEGSHGGSPNTSHQALASITQDFVPWVGRTYCPTHENPLRIETTSQAIDQQPLSGITEQSTINSTPIHSSCSENSGRDSVWSPYPSPHQRGRSLSVGDNLHIVTRKRSLSDAYAMPGNNLLGDFTPNDPYQHFLDIPRSGEQPSGGYMLYTDSDSSMDLQSFHLSGNPGNRRSRSSTRGRSSQSLSPGDRRHQGQSDFPVINARTVRRGSLSNTGSSIKPQVASDAVKRAAWRKRKNPDGRSFECNFCHEKLTTKQNLHYHTSAHLGIRDYACKKCDKRFTTPHVQKRHEKRCSDLRSVSS